MKIVKLSLLTFLTLSFWSLEKTLLAQACLTNCTPMNEDFGTASTCPSQGSGTYAAANPYIVNQCLYNCIGGPAIDDGEYGVVSCRTSNFNAGWVTDPVDHTTGTGDFAMINAGDGPREFYHRNVPNLCAAATYQVSYWFANVGKYNSGSTNDCNYGNPPSITTYRFPSGTTPVLCGGASSAPCVPAGGTALGTAMTPNCLSTSTLNWTQVTYTFTGQTAIDLVLVVVDGNNAGFDFVIDDIQVTWVSGGGVSCVAPIELLSFAAEKSLQNVHLKWSTAEEKNFSHFAIEKSTDGTNFNPIGFINGAGENSSSLKNYEYYDYSGNTEPNAYYRLKQVDKDGTYKYSKVLVLDFDLENDDCFSIQNKFGEIEILFNCGMGAQITVIDMLGNEVYSKDKKSEDSSIKINKSTLADGVYTFKIIANNKVYSRKVVVN